MNPTNTVLQQKAYPSASAFDVKAEPAAPEESAFGATGLLPRVPLQEEPAGTSPQGGGAGNWGGGIPVVSLSEVRDPKLRDALTHLAPPATEAAAPSGSPFSPSQPVGQQPAAPTAEAVKKAPSAFEVAAPTEQQTHDSAFGPATTLIPVQKPAAQPDSSEAEAPASATGLQHASYPSVAGTATGQLPLTGTTPKRPSRVRSTLRSFVSTDQSLTKPMRGVARLAQRPFALATTASRRAEFVREKEEAREVLNFSLRLAETMFHYGADTIDVDSAIVAVCAAYGLDDVEIDITNQSVIINYVSDIDEIDDQTRALSLDDLAEERSAPSKERFSHTVMRVVRSWSENYASLDDIYKLIHDITAGGLPRHKAERRLHSINTAKKPYSPLVIMLANVAAAFSLVLALGGSWEAGTVGGLVFLVIHLVSSLISKLKMPGFFNMAVGAGTVTFASIYISDDTSIFSQLGFHLNAPHIVAAGLIMLLPTARLVSTVQDALNGFPLTAAGKFVSTGMSFLGIVVGLASAVAVLSALGVEELDISQTRFEPAPIMISYVFFMVASLAFAVTTHARWDNLLWVLAIATAGFWIYQGYSYTFGAGAGRANTAIAALVIGLLSTYLAYRLHAPAAIFYVPALTFLLPGLSVFRGLYLFTVEANSDTGLPGMVAAIAIILSMASGVVLGSYLMQYFIQQNLSNDALDTSEKRDR
ncbi:threonine/serine exporter family protein [Rothia endophytica]|uniref:threonine/serine exporter family protein n=1 Tax=Rothia endophytica TaxID=1324766 RepID=UPI001F2B156E|nr:threonine/serine exporter family protein [Rothia endophytica]